MIAGDRILFYYAGAANRHWATHHGDTRSSAIGLATLRLDGFVSINAEKTGTMTTKTFVFVGDTLEVNANAANGSITVEAIDTDGGVIDGFSKDACQAMTTDSVRHVLAWQNNKDCHRLQARPIKLRFYLEKAQLYSFTPRTSHTHYEPSYD